MEEEVKKCKKLNTSSWQRSLFCFLTGWLGFQLEAILVYFVVCLCFSNDYLSTEKGSALANSYTYFIAYALLPLILASILTFPKFGEIFKNIKDMPKIGRSILYGLGLIGVTIVINMICSAIGSALGAEVSDNENQKSIVSIVSVSPFLAFMFIGIFAPVSEELTYRYSLFGGILKYNKILAFVISGLLFGLIHFDIQGIFTMSRSEAINEWLNLPSYILCGLYLSFVYYHEEDLICSTGAHMTNNIISFMLTVLSSSSSSGDTSSVSSLIGMF